MAQENSLPKIQLYFIYQDGNHVVLESYGHQKETILLLSAIRNTKNKAIFNSFFLA